MKTKWAIIGCGRIAEKVSNEIIKKGKHEISTCYSRNQETSAKFSEKFNAKSCLTIEEAILNDNVDCVYISTPHGSHYEILKKCIPCKKPILCEKSFCMTSKQAEEIFKLAKELGVLVTEAMWMKFNPIIREIKNIVESGKIGDPVFVKAEFCYDAKKVNAPERVLDPKAGGGALYDIGVYVIALAHMILGYPSGIQSKSILTDKKTDASTSIVLEYGNTARAYLYCSLMKFTFCKAIIGGVKGKIYLPFIFHKPQRAVVKFKNRKEKKIKLKAKRGYIYQFDEFANESKLGLIESKVVPHSDTIEVLKIMDEIRINNFIEYPDQILKQ